MKVLIENIKFNKEKRTVILIYPGETKVEISFTEYKENLFNIRNSSLRHFIGEFSMQSLMQRIHFYKTRKFFYKI